MRSSALASNDRPNKRTTARTVFMIVEFSHSVGLRSFGMLAGLGGKQFKTARLGDIRVGLARNSQPADKNKIAITLT